jgi:hypothetical protein
VASVAWSMIGGWYSITLRRVVGRYYHGEGQWYMFPMGKTGSGSVAGVALGWWQVLIWGGSMAYVSLDRVGGRCYPLGMVGGKFYTLCRVGVYGQWQVLPWGGCLSRCCG